MYSFVKLTIFFCIGVLIPFQNYLKTVSYYDYSTALFLFFLLFLLCQLLPCLRFQNIKIAFLSTISAYVLCVTSGAWVAKHHEMMKMDSDYSIFSDADYCLLQIDSEISNTYGWQNFKGKVLKVRQHGKWSQATGKINVQVHHQKELRRGEIWIVNKIPQKLTKQEDVWSFNYKNYLLQQGYTGQLSLEANEFVYIKNEKILWIISLSKNIKDYRTRVFRKNIRGSQEFGVMMALLLGDKYFIDKEIKNLYQQGGVTHVLAVSGLHVGIILYIITQLLSPLSNLTKSKLLSKVIILVVLWIFALITGFSSSVLRACVMSSLLIFGKNFGRATTLNILAASIFFLLVFDTSFIFDLGLQLSATAVGGIIYIQPLIQKLYKPSNFLLGKIWQLNCTTLAAQIATFPITIFYFHYFPTWFLLINMIIIPGTTLALFAGLVLLALSPWAAIAIHAGWMIETLLQGLHYLLRFNNNLPFCIINGLNLDSFETISFYLIILSFIIKNHISTKIFYATLFITLTVIFSSLISQTIEGSGQQYFVSFKIKNRIILSYIRDTEMIIISPEKKYQEMIDSKTNLLRNKLGIRKIKYVIQDQIKEINQKDNIVYGERIKLYFHPSEENINVLRNIVVNEKPLYNNELSIDSTFTVFSSYKLSELIQKRISTHYFLEQDDLYIKKL